jgi:hypothetical protein
LTSLRFGEGGGGRKGRFSPKNSPFGQRKVRTAAQPIQLRTTQTDCRSDCLARNPLLYPRQNLKQFVMDWAVCQPAQLREDEIAWTSSRHRHGCRKRHQDPGGDSPYVLSLAGPIPRSGAFASPVLFWEVWVQKNIKRKFEDIIDFICAGGPFGRRMHNSDDRDNYVPAFAPFV